MLKHLLFSITQLKVYGDKPGHEGDHSKQNHVFCAQADLNQRNYPSRQKSLRMKKLQAYPCPTCEVLGLQYQILINVNLKLSHRDECVCVCISSKNWIQIWDQLTCVDFRKKVHAWESNPISRMVTRCFGCYGNLVTAGFTISLLLVHRFATSTKQIWIAKNIELVRDLSCRICCIISGFNQTIRRSQE